MCAALYNDHYGFSERPFSLSPDPDYLYWSKAHTRAWTVLQYGVETRAPLTVITGEVGTGKTTLTQALLRSASAEATIGLISNARDDPGELLRWVLSSFGLDVGADLGYVAHFEQFQDFVVTEYAKGRHVVLIVDEAQNLGANTLEELRMLTNINSGKDELLQIILVGQPELRDLIRQPELRQFAQRVTATYHLKPMDLETTSSYIAHRLKHAGGSGKEFAADAIYQIHGESEGIPRVINKLCDLALVYASSGPTKTVDVATIKELINDGLFLKPIREPLLLNNPLSSVDRAAE